MKYNKQHIIFLYQKLKQYQNGAGVELLARCMHRDVDFLNEKLK